MAIETVSNVASIPDGRGAGLGDLGRGPMDVLIRYVDVDWSWGSTPDPRPLFDPTNTTEISWQGTLTRKWVSPVHVTGGSITGTNAPDITVQYKDSVTGDLVPISTTLDPQTGGYVWSIDATVTEITWTAATAMSISNVSVQGDMVSLGFSDLSSETLIYTTESVVYQTWLNAPIDLLGIFVGGELRDVIWAEDANGDGQYLPIYDPSTTTSGAEPISSNLVSVNQTQPSWAVVDGAQIGPAGAQKLTTLTRVALWMDTSGGTPWPQVSVHLVSDDGNGGWIDHGQFGSTGGPVTGVLEFTDKKLVPGSARVAIVFTGGASGTPYSASFSSTVIGDDGWYAEGVDLNTLTHSAGTSNHMIMGILDTADEIIAQGAPKNSFQPQLIVIEPRHPVTNIVEPRYLDQHYTVSVTDETGAAPAAYRYSIDAPGGYIRVNRDPILTTTTMANGFSFCIDITPASVGMVARHEGLWDLELETGNTLKVTAYDDDGTSVLAQRTTETITVDGNTTTRIIVIVDTTGAQGAASIYINNTAATLTDAGSVGSMTTFPASNGAALFIGGTVNSVTGFTGTVARIRYHPDHIFDSNDLYDISQEDVPRAICHVRIVPNPNFILPLINIPGMPDTVHGSLEGGWPPPTEISFANNTGVSTTGYAATIVPDGSAASYYAQVTSINGVWSPHCANNLIDENRCLAAQTRFRTPLCREDCPAYSRPTINWNTNPIAPGEASSILIRVKGSAPGVQGSDVKVRIALKH